MLRSSALLRRGFTLIEMLTVMLIIAILAGIILNVNGLVQNKAARARAEGEMKSLSLFCENYKTDNGTYPRNTDTDALDPRVDFAPTGTTYQMASQYLYKALSGDSNLDLKFTDGEGKNYGGDFFTPARLKADKDGSGSITAVKYLKDPFDGCYGYSTKGAAEEEAFVESVRIDPKATRPASSGGYNPTYDLWSTAGAPQTAAGQSKWVKNW